MDTLQPAAATRRKTPSAAAPGLRGVHHVVLNTDDMARTIDFYTSVLGAKLIHALRVPPGLGTGPENRGNPPFENLRHYFFDMGNDSLLAFFELPREEVGEADRNSIGAMQHLSFAVTPARAEKMLATLEERGIDHLGPIDVGAGTLSVYFYDPNDVRLEFSWKPVDGESINLIDTWSQTKSVILEELRTLDADRSWDGVIAHLPD